MYELPEKAADSKLKHFCSENVFSFLHLLHIYIQVHFRHDIFTEATNMNPYQTAQSLIWVHIVCNIGYLSTYVDERADNKSHDWRGNGYVFPEGCIFL